MKLPSLLVFLAALFLVPLNSRAQQSSSFGPQAISISGRSVAFTNSINATVISVVETISGVPAAMSIATYGCYNASGCTALLDTYTGTTSTTRQVTGPVYDYVTVAATWTGNNVSVSITGTLSNGTGPTPGPTPDRGGGPTVSCSTANAFIYWLTSTTEQCDPNIKTDKNGNLTATSFVSPSDNVHAGGWSAVGNTTVPAFTSNANSFGWLAPSSSSFTSYFLQPSTTAPNANFMKCAAPVSGVSACTWASPSGGTAPQVAVESSGTAATYTTPVGALYIVVEMVGGGGGGQGSGTTPGSAGSGSASSFSTLTANGGGGGGLVAAGVGGAGGTASGGDINFTGNPGGNNNNTLGTFYTGARGGESFFGGAGQSGTTAPGVGGDANTNSGSGGGGAGANSVATAGNGGGAGGFTRKLITTPSSTYTYTVGAGGSGGTLGTSGAAGGAGAAGIIVVTAYFQ